MKYKTTRERQRADLRRAEIQKKLELIDELRSSGKQAEAMQAEVELGLGQPEPVDQVLQEARKILVQNPQAFYDDVIQAGTLSRGQMYNLELTATPEEREALEAVLELTRPEDMIRPMGRG